ncbi:nitric oxide reductase activation protein NorD [Actinomadura scrupuli]|uniref:nitric oxide reductase activation protein NorD n=1 Tax=Actinomadura scrupuli TaxID=559629 RepID=UPI003D999D81
MTNDEAGRAALARWTLLAGALSGRTVRVGAVDPGEEPWTDGETIYLDPRAERAEQIAALAVQASLLCAGSLEPDLVRALVRRPSRAGRYLAVEGRRALAQNRALLPRAARSLLDESGPIGTDSPRASLAVACGRGPVPAAPAAFGVIRPRELRRAGPEADAAGGHVPRRHREREPAVLDAEAAEGAQVVDLYSSPVGGGGGVGRLLRKMLGSVRRLGEGGSPGADSPTHRMRSGARGGGNAVISAADDGSPDESAALPGGVTYPEWDARRRAYRPGWCTVRETMPTEERELEPDRRDGNALRGPLARLAFGVDRARRQPQGEDVDIDAAIAARAAVLARSVPDEAVYVASLRRRRDLSVLILLDVSGSAGEPGESGRTVHEAQRAAAGSLARALHGLGDRVALYAFNSQGRNDVRLMPVKRFDDGLDGRVLRRLGGLVPSAYSRLGAAVRHGAAVLEARGGTSRRLLVVLSDGLAYDHGYERDHGAADVRRALAEARGRGTACLCLTIGADTAAGDLRRAFGSAAHATVPRLGDLGLVVAPMIRSAIRSAEVGRRVS